MATYQTGWSAGKSNFGALLSSKEASQYFSLPISTINSAISSIGANYQISSITIYATIRVENSAPGYFTCRVGYGGSGSIGTQLNSMTLGNGLPATGTLSASLNSAISGNRLNASYGGGYVTFHIDSSAWGKKTYNISNVYVDVNYYLPSYEIKTNVTPAEAGTVSGAGTHNRGANVTLTAIPATGYRFKCWQDDTSNTNSTRTFTAIADATYTAVFEKLKYNVTARVAPSGNGSVTGAGTYEHGDTVTLSATVNEGCRFWAFIDNNTDERYYENPYSFVISSDRDFTVNIPYLAFIITVLSNNDDYGSASGSGDYRYGEEVTLVATPNYGYKFVQWSDGVTTPTRTITVKHGGTYTAIFEIDRINYILIDTTQTKLILLNTAEADKIFADTTKVYG